MIKVEASLNRFRLEITGLVVEFDSEDSERVLGLAALAPELTMKLVAAACLLQSGPLASEAGFEPKDQAMLDQQQAKVRDHQEVMLQMLRLVGVKITGHEYGPG